MTVFMLQLTKQLRMALQLFSVFAIYLTPTNFNIFHSAYILTPFSIFNATNTPTPFYAFSVTDNSSPFSIRILTDFRCFQFSLTHLISWFLSDSSAPFSPCTLPNTPDTSTPFSTFKFNPTSF